MALIEVTDVLPSGPDAGLRGSHVDLPRPGGGSDCHALDVNGWVVGRDWKAVAVEIDADGSVVRSAAVDRPRPDVAALFPEAPEAAGCGFAAKVGMLGVPPQFELLLEAVSSDGRRTALARIRGRRQLLESGFQPGLQPLMITSLGRTGTTWLMRLLAEHPAIVAERSYPYETRAASYWMHMLKVLSEPANHTQSSHPDDFQYDPFWVGHHPSYCAPLTRHSEVRRWFGRTYPASLAAFCQSSLEACYRRVAADQGQTGAVYFAEKYHPRHIPWLIWELYPRARELVLVRDFRDMVCSILAFNARRGFAAFGRQDAVDDADYVRRLRGSAVRLLATWHSRSDKIHLVRYEELVRRPEPTLQNVLEYLALDSAPSVIRAMLRRAEEDTPELRRHRTSANGEASMGRWRRELSPAMAAECRLAFDDILHQFGYNPDAQEE